MPGNLANGNMPKKRLVASSPGVNARAVLKHLVPRKPLSLGRKSVDEIVLFLLKVAALEAVRRLSRARCPFVWRAVQSLQLLGYVPFKWLQRWGPLRIIVKGVQKFSRPLLCLSIATALTDHSENGKRTVDRMEDCQPDSDLPNETSVSDMGKCGETSEKAVCQTSEKVVSENWLVQLHEELEKQGISLPERIDDNELQRFYIAANGDLSCLLSSLKRTIRWRETYYILSSEELEMWSHLVFWHGRDVMLRPCLVIRLGLACSTLSAHDRPSFSQAIGCVRVGLFAKAVDLFRAMRMEAFNPNGFVVASLVTGCNYSAERLGGGYQLHGLVMKHGLMSNVYVGTALLYLYGSYGFVFDAWRLSQEMPEKNVVSWTALMVSYSANGHPEEALRAYQQMRIERVVCNQNSFATVISSCGMLENEKLSLQVLAHVVVCGFESEVSVANSMITLFGNLGRVEDAEQIFRRMQGKDTISWNSMISMYSHEGMCEESFQCFSEMQSYNMKPDATTLSSLISACGCVDNLKWGRGIHALAIKDGLGSFVSVCNTLVNMYSMSGRLKDSEMLFCEIPERDLISWNTMLSSYIQSGDDIGALKLLAQLLREKKETNYVTFASVLGACSSPEALKHGKMVHAFAIYKGLLNNLLLSNALITMYSKCNAMRDAKSVFQAMPDHDVVSWNTLIGGHVENEEHMEAMQVFTWMRKAGMAANYITMVNVLGICSAPKDLMQYGKPLHALTIVTGFDLDEFVKNSLITMYAKCGDFLSSGVIFDGLNNKSMVSWNAMIASKAHHGHGEDALKHFIDMRHAGMKLDRFSLSGAFAATASLASLEEGQQLHGLITRLGFESDLHVINAAMDMYGKCGKLDDLLKLLPESSNRSRLSWNIMISAFARHGLFCKAEDTFKEMLRVGPKPDHVTFVSLLSACSHAGLVEKGVEYYNSMTREFDLSPRIEHCVCMVDLLGRSGRLMEAERFIEDMPVSPNDLIWRSLLSSSRTHRNLDIGRRAAQRLLELDPLDDSAYVLLSNAYALNKRWEDVEKLRMHMKLLDLKKKPACSWIKVTNKVSSFGIGDRSHPQTKQIHAKLEEVLQMVKEVGYIADTSFALHDTDEEQKEHNLWNHSEKLALAFGLMEVPQGSAIRVFKNLRVCGDCHLVYKLVSKVVNREIVLRDPYRFHHFKVGTCSCSDYW